MATMPMTNTCPIFDVLSIIIFMIIYEKAVKSSYLFCYLCGFGFFPYTSAKLADATDESKVGMRIRLNCQTHFTFVAKL